MSESPTFFPAAPAIWRFASEHARSTARQRLEQQQQRLLPASTSGITRGEAVILLRRAVERAKNNPLGDKITEDNQPIVEGCIASLFPVYGTSSDDARGNPKSPDPAKRHNWVRGLAWIFKRDGLTPYQVFNALEAAPAKYDRMPTSGQLKGLAHGQFFDQEGDT